ncbi:MAG TPA: hypothetical protein VK658_09415 [Chryseolinea sp.]|nr:hypothetical protein [Chryseolinea sp.]
MRVLATLIFFALLATASAKNPEPAHGLQTYVTSFSSVDGFAVNSEELLQLVQKLREKHGKSGNNAAFVGYLFDKTRHRFLRNYAEYATFSETINKGTYNCLTGTALYALLLEHFDIPYQVIETNYHIFLVAETENGRVLLEATDRQNGVLLGESKIEARIKEYRQGLPSKSDHSKTYYQYEADVYRQVTLDELTGLLYYNRAIVAYNQHDLPAAIDRLIKSSERYQSPRTLEFAAILQITVAASDLSASLKQEYLRKIQRLRASAVTLSARRQ